MQKSAKVLGAKALIFLKTMQKITEFKRIRHKERLRTKEIGGKSSKSAIKATIKRGIEKEF